MREAGFNTVRVAEFDWVHLEPREGHYDFSFWDRLLEDLQRAGLKALFCTPTASMPAWVAQKYPEALAVKRNGQRIRWGARKNACLSQPDFRRLSRDITRAMAEHYAGHETIIGWQTDNELQEPVCYCHHCRKSFQQWLQDKYGTIGALNAAWGTHFWGHTLDDWSQIEIPDYWISNPGAMLDWKRHYSWLNVTFQQEQIDILRPHFPDRFITHNLMSLFTQVNYHELARELDFVSWDNYPVWNSQTVRYEASLVADLTRGHKARNYWILEQTAGPPGGPTFMRNPWPGEIRSVAYQQLAHGCDGMTWFRWRTCTTGAEQYWHGLLGHDGVPGRRYREAAETAREFHQLAPLLEGTTVQARAAMLYDYDSLWGTEFQPQFEHNDYIESLKRYHQACFDAGVNLDVIPPDRDFSGYRLLIVSRQYVVTAALAEALEAFVQGGGIVLVDARSGVKDGCNRCYELTLPGLLRPMLGVRIDEYGSFGKDTMQVPLAFEGQDTPFPETATAIHYADWLTPETAEPIARYVHPFLGDYAALTRHRFGQGQGWYLGTVVQEPAFYASLIRTLLQEAQITPEIAVPPGVELSVRADAAGQRRLVFLLNHTAEQQVVPLPRPYRDAFSGETVETEVRLPSFDVAVLRNA
ncbi:MAG: beta-galactosidase [Puniceicoccaceae bacterium 5H]|nr:MAG: beta-galactosidase [Puniceicoccaceae bacterium 5H]